MKEFKGEIIALALFLCFMAFGIVMNSYDSPSASTEGVGHWQVITNVHRDDLAETLLTIPSECDVDAEQHANLARYTILYSCP